MKKIVAVILIAMTALMLVGFTRGTLVPTQGEVVASTAAAEAEGTVPNPIFASLFIFILAGFVGFEVIGRVSPTLHTPLMSATNAISGISLVGSIVAAGAKYSTTSTILGCIAVAAATTNVVGGFMITDRMLRMFKRKDRGHS